MITNSIGMNGICFVALPWILESATSMDPNYVLDMEFGNLFLSEMDMNVAVVNYISLATVSYHLIEKLT